MMYRMKKIIRHEENIVLPKCMYTIKNMYNFEDTFVYQEINDTDLNINKQSPNEKMSELEQRQQQLLEKLDTLYDRIKSLSSICTITSNRKSQESKKSMLPIPDEVVLAAGPDNLPWFIILFLKQNNLQVNVNWHIHSSVPYEKVPKIKSFVKNFTASPGSQVNMRLIFKGGLYDSELRLSSLSIPIVGNVNILRYLAFVYPSTINYEHENYYVDSLLDICHMLERVPEKNKEALVNKLFVQYKNWIYKDDFSIVDLAAFSAVKQWRNASKFIPKEWLIKCENYL